MAVPTDLSGNSQGTSTRPYLLRALHDWCTDNGFTPYIAVHVDDSVQVPREYVKNHEIVLNVGFEATTNLKLGNDFIEFKARFGGSAREILVPIDHVVAIYARENGQGMAFPVPTAGGKSVAASDGKSGAASGAAPATAEATASVEPRPQARPTALRGLRLASSEVPPSAEPDPIPGADDGDPPDPSDPGPRPTLKRVK
jgi:stringent starvation protein B